MNHGIFIIKIIEKPLNIVYRDYSVLKIPVLFPKLLQKGSKNDINLILWGTFREDFINYYKIKDYLLIEGIITSKSYTNHEEEEKEEVSLIAKRVYPFLLD